MRFALLLAFLCLISVCVSQTCVATEYVNGKLCTECKDSSRNSCVGCNGLPAAPGDNLLLFDQCGACGGDGTSCKGCDGTNNGKSYDLCGVCGGNDACSDVLTDFVTFSPEDSGKSKTVYKLPLTITMTSKTPGAKIYYKYVNITGDDLINFSPPNLLSSSGSELVTVNNITIKAIAFINGKRVSIVKSATYQVSITGSSTSKSGTLIPIWAIVVIVVVGSLLVVGILLAIFIIRIRNRVKLVAIRLDEEERAAKEDTFRAIYDYKAQNNDELDLKIGDVVIVKERHEDGWWTGKSYRLKGKEGVFPGNYVELVPPDRLMWVERPKTVMGRISQRVSNFFAGESEYGTDPQMATTSPFTSRVSRAFGIQNQNNNYNNSNLKPIPKLPPKLAGGPLPPKPNALPPRPDHY